MEIYRFNPEVLQGASIVTVPANEVPQDAWADLQALQEEYLEDDLIGALPSDANQDSIDQMAARAAVLTNNRDVGQYAQQRGTSRFVAQHGLRPEQSYRDSQVTLVLNQNNTVIGGAATVLNASSRLPGPLGRAHRELALHTEGMRHVKIMDVIGREPEVAIAGIVGALEARRPRDGVRAYLAPGELPDQVMQHAVNALGMSVVGSDLQEGVPGYPSPLRVDTYAGQVDLVLDHVYGVDGVRELMENVRRLDRLPE